MACESYTLKAFIFKDVFTIRKLIYLLSTLDILYFGMKSVTSFL